MTTHLGCRLFNLPPELHLYIYSYVVPAVPLAEAGIVYKGLVYSCKQASAEVQLIILKAIGIYYSGITRARHEAYSDQITFRRLHNLVEVEKLELVAHLNRPISAPPLTEHTLQQIIYLHLQSLSIQTSRDSGPKGYNYRWLPTFIKPFILESMLFPMIKWDSFTLDLSKIVVGPPVKISAFPSLIYQRII